MFDRFKNNRNPNVPPNYNGYFPENQFQQVFYQLEETNRKLRNLNNRLRRIENYLGLRNDDKYDNDMFMED